MRWDREVGRRRVLRKEGGASGCRKNQRPQVPRPGRGKRHRHRGHAAIFWLGRARGVSLITIDALIAAIVLQRGHS